MTARKSDHDHKLVETRQRRFVDYVGGRLHNRRVEIGLEANGDIALKFKTLCEGKVVTTWLNLSADAFYAMVSCAAALGLGDTLREAIKHGEGFEAEASKKDAAIGQECGD